MIRKAKTTIKLLSVADIDKITSSMPKKEMLDAKRQLRVSLFQAFDKHKGNIAYGAETETEEQKDQILKWREDLKDLKTEAFKEIPEAIKYYYEGDL